MDQIIQHKLINELKKGPSKGSSQALDSIYRQIGPSILRYLISIRCPNPEDVLQDTFIALYQQASKLRPDTTLQAWLFKVARNKAFKGISRHQMVPVEDNLLSQESHDPNDTLAVHQALACLEETFRSILSLFHWEGLTLEEISEVMEIPVNTVKTRLFRARQQLKKCLMTPNQGIKADQASSLLPGSGTQKGTQSFFQKIAQIKTMLSLINLKRDLKTYVHRIQRRLHFFNPINLILGTRRLT